MIVLNKSVRRLAAMGKCLKGESEVKKKEAKFACQSCGAKTDKKSHVCKPKKLKQESKHAFSEQYSLTREELNSELT